jgi:hypothetical protein
MRTHRRKLLLAGAATSAAPGAGMGAAVRASRRGRPQGRIVWRLLWLLAAVALGLGSAWGMLRSVSGYGASAGPWRASTLAGSPDADLYTRARVALGGLLALNREETMYFVAATDSAGAPLRSRCSYRVSGVPPQARWWSVTAYADDLFLFPNPQRRYSVNGASAPLDAQGRFALLSGPTSPVGAQTLPWLPTPGDRGLMFTLRVYNPDPALAAAPGTLQAPRIELLGDCR